MSIHTTCRECGGEILESTAEATGGLCMPCKNGFRKNIEDSKRYYAEQRKYNPHRELWSSLVKRVYQTKGGYESLSADEKVYFAVGVLSGEVANGGTHQFFWNSSGSLYYDAVDGLRVLEANNSLELLLRAKAILFENMHPPVDRSERWDCMKQYPEDPTVEDPAWVEEIQTIDKAFWDELDGLEIRLQSFAEHTGLIEPFKKLDEP